MVRELVIAPEDRRFEKGEKPAALHSIQAAVREVARLRATHQAADHVTVICRGGVYPLRSPVVITPDDPAGITFAAAKGEIPVFDGGVKLSGWEKCRINGRTVLRACVPEYAVFDGRIENLYVNGRAARVASYPKFPGGQPLEIEKTCPVDADEFHNASEAFYYREGDFDPAWYNRDGIEALVLQLWTDSRLPIACVDPVARRIRFKKSSAWRFNEKSVRYYWQNVREALTDPGEFYFDNTDSYVYYLPRRGEKPETLDAWVARLPVLVALIGEPEKNRFVEDISFEGLRFRHGGAGRPQISKNYTFPNASRLPHALPNFFAKDFWEGQPENNVDSSGSPQAAAQLPGVLLLAGARRCRIRGCEIYDSNFYGIALTGGCSDVKLEYNTIHHMGAGGVVINGANVARRPELYPFATHHVSACDNHIHDCGNFYPAASGFLVGHAWGNRLEHNHIHDLYYSGFSVGWSWGFGDSSCRENRIGFNHIHDLGKGMLCDMGGVYLLGIQPGTRVYNNHIHDIFCRIYGGWGIYCDEGSSHEVIENNVCYDCAKEGFHQHFGRETIVRGNLFACNRAHQLTLTRGKTWTPEYAFPGECTSRVANIFGNIFVSEGGPFFRSMFMDMKERDQFYCDGNLFWDAAPKAKRAAVFAAIAELLAEKYEWSCDFAAWRELGRDLHSEFADPGFVDVKKRDFHFKKGAYAKKRGFFDPAETLDLAGVRSEENQK
ncbi:MAG: right-handed parallel beta-helix repeat-containing protein [Victivallaceae bacterium]|nr:right-handed parallel beta-helix repeat-containing protein [Victivallaceae bacterium]